MPATVGGNHLDPSDNLTTGGSSPYEPPKPLPRAAPELSLDPKNLKSTSIDSIAELRGLYPLETREGQKYLVTIGKNGTIFGRGPTEDHNHYVLGQLTKDSQVIAMSQTKGLLAAVDEQGVYIRALASSEPAQRMRNINSRITAMDFSPKGESLLIGGADGMVYLWRFEAEKNGEDKGKPERLLQRYPGLSSTVSSVAFFPTGNFFMAGDWLGDIYAWQRYDADRYAGEYDRNISGKRFLTAKTVRTRVRKGRGVGLDKIAYDPAGQFLVAGFQDGSLELWKLKGTSLEYTVPAHERTIYSLSMEPREDGRLRVVSTGKDGHLKIWHLKVYEKEIEEKAKRRSWKASLQQDLAKKDLAQESVNSVDQESSNLSLEEAMASQAQPSPTPEMIKRRVVKHELELEKDISMPGVVAATFLGEGGLYAGNKSGKVAEISLPGES